MKWAKVFKVPFLRSALKLTLAPLVGRNKVWQMDFMDFGSYGGGTDRKHLDAICAVKTALAEYLGKIGHSLVKKLSLGHKGSEFLCALPP
ncbi:MAG: hypothetical protein JW395_1647 [Nitrospira sp.]|nr:hypothetical protein [Nitrospira sp.]